MYAEVRSELGFVPHLFTSLALFPNYLVLAWEQTKPLIGSADFSNAATRLVDRASSYVPPPRDPEAKAILAGRASGRMLLLSAGLRLALDGRLSAPSAVGVQPVGEPRLGVMDERRSSESTFGEIRRDLDTPIVNELWHLLAEAGELEATWRELAPQARGALALGTDLETDAYATAARLPWHVAADATAARREGCGEVLPAIEQILETFCTTLARVLILVAPAHR